jgi:diguanylate cyclase (GGDEF)-like protein/PAS domain S-box-containing protein
VIESVLNDRDKQSPPAKHAERRRGGSPASHPPTAGEAEAAAKVASYDADAAADAAADANLASQLAALAAARLATRAKAVTAAAVAAAAVAVAESAAAAAAAMEDDAAARAIETAAAAVDALEAAAAERPADRDDAAADKLAAAVAATVAADVLAAEALTAAAAKTVAEAVVAAAETAAATAVATALAVEREAQAAADVSRSVVAASATTTAAADVVVGSTRRVAELAARLSVVTALHDSEQRFRVLFDNAPVGMMLVSLGSADPGRLLRVNPALQALTGRTDGELLGLTVADLFDVDDRAEQRAVVTRLASGETGAHESESLWRDRAGREIWVHTSLHSIRDDEQGPAYAVGQVEDITERRRAEASLRRREERFRRAFENSVTGIAFVGVDGTVQKVNEALVRLLGRTEGDLLGQHLEVVAAEDERAAIRGGMERVVVGELTIYQEEHRFVRADGRELWVLLSGSVEHGDSDYLVFQVTDISGRKDAEGLLAHQAFHDELTGLPNRVRLREHLDRACARAVRNGTYIAVLFLDIDDFKEVNDSLGHIVGDQVLVEVGARLHAALRGDDMAVRLGGDEFVIVCEGLHDPAESSPVAERILEALAAPVVVGAHELRVSVSIGINTSSQVADPAELLRGADTAMYQAKVAGKDRSEIYNDEMSVRALRRVTVAAELAHAVQRDELRLHYQPTYELRTGAIGGVEALVRWEHPTRGLLAPVDFLDVAEGRRLMIPIGDWVLAAAVTQAAAWQRDFGDRAPDIWVNIAGQQLGRGRLPELIKRLLAATGLSAARLGLEITERQLVGREATVRGDLIAVRALGVRLAIDDFGTGFASLEYLRRFTFDEIKIDQSFISGLDRDATDTAVTRAIIALGRSLDLVVVAEGIDSPEQYRALQRLDCDIAQGYLMQRPAPAEAVTALLAADARYVS